MSASGPASPAGCRRGGRAERVNACRARRYDPRMGLPTLHGRRVTLRPATRADAARLYEILFSPGVSEWWPCRGPDECEEILADESIAAFMVEADGQPVGLIQYSEEATPDYRHASVDIALHAGWQGRGLGTDAVRTLVAHLVRDLGHHRVTIDPAASNARAIRVYEKVGFRPVGILRRYERGADGTWHDGLLMDLLADELTEPPA